MDLSAYECLRVASGPEYLGMLGDRVIASNFIDKHLANPQREVAKAKALECLDECFESLLKFKPVSTVIDPNEDAVRWSIRPMYWGDVVGAIGLLLENESQQYGEYWSKIRAGHMKFKELPDDVKLEALTVLERSGEELPLDTIGRKPVSVNLRVRAADLSKNFRDWSVRERRCYGFRRGITSTLQHWNSEGQKYFNYRVLPYVDVCLVASYLQVPLTYEDIASIIYGDLSGETIRKTRMKLAVEATEGRIPFLARGGHGKKL